MTLDETEPQKGREEETEFSEVAMEPAHQDGATAGGTGEYPEVEINPVDKMVTFTNCSIYHLARLKGLTPSIENRRMVLREKGMTVSGSLVDEYGEVPAHDMERLEYIEPTAQKIEESAAGPELEEPQGVAEEISIDTLELFQTAHGEEPIDKSVTIEELLPPAEKEKEPEPDDLFDFEEAFSERGKTDQGKALAQATTELLTIPPTDVPKREMVKETVPTAQRAPTVIDVPTYLRAGVEEEWRVTKRPEGRKEAIATTKKWKKKRQLIKPLVILILALITAAACSYLFIPEVKKEVDRVTGNLFSRFAKNRQREAPGITKPIPEEKQYRRIEVGNHSFKVKEEDEIAARNYINQLRRHIYKGAESCRDY